MFVRGLDLAGEGINDEAFFIVDVYEASLQQNKSGNGISVIIVVRSILGDQQE